MYVCLCSPITDSELEELLKTNPDLTIDDLKEQGVADNCASCLNEIECILNNRKNNGTFNG